MASHLEVARRWAQYDPANPLRDLHGHHMFTAGSRIYSYGHHFLLGQWWTLASGERIVLLNAASRSISTTRHQSIVRNALLRHAPNTRAFTTPFNDLTQATVDYYNALAVENEDKAKRARVHKDGYLSLARSYRDSALEFSTILNAERRAA